MKTPGPHSPPPARQTPPAVGQTSSAAEQEPSPFDPAPPPTGRVVVALDLPAPAPALALVDRLGDACAFYKVGLELYTAGGPGVVEALRKRGKAVFLDLKLHDIPRTVAGAAARAGELGASLLTVHAMGGPAMLAAAVEAAPPGLAVLGVTVLTSLDGPALEAVLGRPVTDMEAEVARLAVSVRDAGLHGVVCSAAEAALARRVLPPGAEIVTPGIRLPGGAVHDQRRTRTPSEAFHAGATRIVAGRMVTDAPDPVAVLRRVSSEHAAVPSPP